MHNTVHWTRRVLSAVGGERSNLAWNALAGYRRDWVGELAIMAVYRLSAIAVSATIVAILAVVSPFAGSPFVLGIHAYWMANAALLLVLQARARSVQRASFLGAAAWLVDIVLLTTIMALSGPTWWFGLVYMTLIAAMGMITLPPGARPWVVSAAWLAASTLAQAHAFDVLPPGAWIDSQLLPSWLWPAIPVLSGGLPLAAMAWQLHLTLGRFEANFAEYRTVVSLAPDPIWMMRRDGVLLAMNKAGLRLLGRPFEELVGRSLLEYIAPVDHNAVCTALDTPDLTSSITLHVSLLRNDGEQAQIDVSLVSGHDDGGEPVLFGLARDLTSLYEAAHARAALKIEHERARGLRRMAKVVGGLAHELNNPLAAIVSALDADPYDGTGELFGSLRTRLNSRAREAQSVLHDLLLVTSPPRQLSRTLFDLRRTIDRALNSVSSRVLAAGCVIHTAFDLDDALISGCEPLLERAFEHLVTNAIDANPWGGTVSVTIATHDDHFVVQVEDSGAGFPASMRHRLFEPFASTKPHRIGLGLPFAHHVITQHNGQLRYGTGASGTGTVAEVRLPIHRDSPAHRRHTRAIAPDAQPYLLIVEDEEAIALSLTRYFERRGWIVAWCMTAHDALSRLDASESARVPDVVLSDVRLPGMSGLELYGQFARTTPSLADRFVFMTGDTTSPDVSEGLAAVPRPVLIKPFLLEELYSTVERVRSDHGL